jgi:hypothetical protein
VAFIKQKKNANRALVEMSEARPLGNSRPRRKDNIK